MNVPFMNSAPQEPPIPPPSYPEHGGMYAAWEQEDMTGTAGIALDNSSLVQQIESFLSGKVVVEVRDKEGRVQYQWQQVAEAKMNEKGVRAVILEIRARLDKNTIMTYFPNYDELLKYMEHFSTNLVLFLGQNIDDFQIKPSYASQIADFIVDNVYITLLRGLEGNTKEGVFKQVRRIENATQPLNSPQMMKSNQSGGLFR